MNPAFKRLLGNITSLGLVRGLDYLVPVVTLPYLMRVIGLDLYGLIDYAIALARYFSAVINYGFGVTAVRNIALERQDKNLVSKTYSETMTAIGLLILLAGAVYVPIVVAIEAFRAHLALYLFAFAFVSLQALFPAWLFRGLERIALGAKLTAASRILYVISLLTFVRGPEDYTLVIAANAFTMLLAVIASVFYARRVLKLEFRLPTQPRLTEVYKNGFDAFIAQLAPNLYNNSAAFLLGVFSGTAAVGAFSAAKKVVEVFNAAGLILSNAIFPYLLQHANAVRTAHRVLWVCAVLLSLTCFLSAEFATNLLFPDVEEPIASYIRILSVGILGYFGSAIYNANGLLLLKKDGVVRRNSIGVSVVFFFLGLVAIPFLGIFGSLGMLVGARLLMAGCGWWSYRKANAEIIRPS